MELLEGMDEAFCGGLVKAIIEDAGHFVHREKPDEVNARVLRFLDK